MKTAITDVTIEMRVTVRGDYPRDFAGEAAQAAWEYVDETYPDEKWTPGDCVLENYDRYVVHFYREAPERQES